MGLSREERWPGKTTQLVYTLILDGLGQGCLRADYSVFFNSFVNEHAGSFCDLVVLNGASDG